MAAAAATECAHLHCPAHGAQEALGTALLHAPGAGVWVWSPRQHVVHRQQRKGHAGALLAALAMHICMHGGAWEE